MMFGKSTYLFGTESFGTMLRFVEAAKICGVKVDSGNIWHAEKNNAWLATYRCSKRKGQKIKSVMYGRKIKDGNYIWGA